MPFNEARLYPHISRGVCKLYLSGLLHGKELCSTSHLSLQPGCPNKKSKSTSNDLIHHELKLEDIIVHGDGLDPTCSHGRAHEYFTESINSECEFTATFTCYNPRRIPDLVSTILSRASEVGSPTNHHGSRQRREKYGLTMDLFY